MKNNLLIIIFIQFILVSSCEKKEDPNVKEEEPKIVLDDFIPAGQKTGEGIKYVDLQPDINLTIIDPGFKNDTTVYLDLNLDSVNDFKMYGSMCDPSMLGADCEDLWITPLNENEICIQTTGWLDTIPHSGIIGSADNWSDQEALIYSYNWVLGLGSETDGHWQDVAVPDTYYIGYRINKDEKRYYGWIGMHRDTTAWIFSFYLTDYAIVEEYEE